jgi:asparagine synthase (glutamine-hydrolysing)
LCGIAGIVVGKAVEADFLTRDAKAMAATMIHRGPDDEGIWDDGTAALAFRRLSIIDLKGGHQPMIGPSKAVIVFNGEIYNYVEVRQELEGCGVVFRTQSDTEVLLAAFERWGDDCLRRLNGMFAFAIWLPDQRRLFFARDRLGKKPFHYFIGDGFFAFGSEVKALLALEQVRVKADFDPLAISDVLSLGYILGPKTAYAGIRQLPAGSCGWWSPSTKDIAIREYWDLAGCIESDRRPFDAMAIEEFGSLFEDAVSIRLRSDVPLGAYLSGGVDSAAVTAVMTGRAGVKVNAYCVGFSDGRFDESKDAAETAKHLGIGLNTLYDDGVTDIDLEKLLWHFDAPFVDTSSVPSFRLHRQARRHVTVALSGDGGDEVLAGYSTYRADQYYRLFKALPDSLQSAVDFLTSKLVRPSYRKVGWDYKLRQFVRARGLSPERAHYWWRVIFSEAEKARILGPELKRRIGDYDPFETFARRFAEVPTGDFLDRCLYVDIKTWLQDDILVKVDRLSMANSVEVRSPFLDYRLVEFCARLAPFGKMDRHRQKIILKEAMRNLLPTRILNRPKQGFGSPTQRFAFDRLDAGELSGLFNSEFRLDGSSEDVTYKSFCLGMLGLWLKMFSRNRLQGLGQTAI